MTEARRRRPSSREKLLAAAAELVGKIGARRLTLAAVAERAGISKGGLLYHFPSKDALLQGMIERLVDDGVSAKDQFRREMRGKPNLEARVSIAASLKIRQAQMNDVANGLLAALAENPKLLDPVRRVIAEHWQAMKAGSDDVDAALVAWLAIEGLGSLEMHGISPASREDRTRIAHAVVRLLDKGLPR
jgi:AcrR family transcriptional regulator